MPNNLKITVLFLQKRGWSIFYGAAGGATIFLLVYLGMLLTGIGDHQTGFDLTEGNNKDMKQEKKRGGIRPPAVAGSFYPADKEELSKKIKGFLENIRIRDGGEARTPKIILVPHAGYEYSGAVAAHGYKLLEGKAIKTVIILGSSHNYPIAGIVADGSDSWETPLDKVNLDKELIGKLDIPVDSIPFEPEHSLEVQLPFLQKVLGGDFKIVPILVGDMSETERKNYASQIANNLDENTIVVISSDMSHYPNYGDANKYDQEVINSILTSEVDKFTDKLAELIKKNVPNAATFMCAAPATELGMMIAKVINAHNVQLLKYANSGDVTGDRSRVVGYSAMAFFKNVSEKNVFLSMAREAAESFVKNSKFPDFSGWENKEKLLRQKAGVFVTLRNKGNLRGCIGLVESNQPLYETIPQMAAAAARDDHRFSPVTVGELPEIEYEVSILSPMKKIENIEEIKLGVHGVKVQNGTRTGVFLPQVAQESSWSLKEFMSHLCQDKAGLPTDCWKDASTEIYIFTAQVFSE
jgi:AmmeMemoRadiSam system protein B/AmmeMemoRadiSam system protein A